LAVERDVARAVAAKRATKTEEIGLKAQKFGDVPRLQ
jgi:hypothetical protein